MNEGIVHTPIMEQAAAELRENGRFIREFSAQDVEAIMHDILSVAMTQQRAVQIRIDELNMKIENSRGIVQGKVHATHGMGELDVKVSGAMGNTDDPTRIALQSLGMDAGFFGGMALAATGAEDRVRKILGDPNYAFWGALTKQMQPRGVELTGMGLHFNPTTLAVDLAGNPVQK